MGQNCPGLPTVRQVFAPAEMGAHDRGYKVTGTYQVPTVRHHGEVDSRQARQNALNLWDSAQNVSHTMGLLCPSRLYVSV
jgi:hypothetical protein